MQRNQCVVMLVMFLIIVGVGDARVKYGVPQRPVFTIMLDPAGDARTPGRTIDDTFERGISLQCTEWLKAELERRFTGIRVILTRLPGETLEPLQNASFANRLHADLYVSVHCYQAQGERPSIAIMHLMCTPTDRWELKHEPLSCIPYDQAHRIAKRATMRWAEILAAVFQEERHLRLLQFQGVFGIPFRPLIGILCPALAVEMSLAHKDDWKVPARALLEGIEQILVHHTTHHQREE